MAQMYGNQTRGHTHGMCCFEAIFLESAGRELGKTWANEGTGGVGPGSSVARVCVAGGEGGVIRLESIEKERVRTKSETEAVQSIEISRKVSFSNRYIPSRIVLFATAAGYAELGQEFATDTTPYHLTLSYALSFMKAMRRHVSLAQIVPKQVFRGR